MKKIFAVILVSALLCGLLSACGNTNAQNGKEENSKIESRAEAVSSQQDLEETQVGAGEPEEVSLSDYPEIEKLVDEGIEYFKTSPDETTREVFALTVVGTKLFNDGINIDLEDENGISMFWRFTLKDQKLAAFTITYPENIENHVFGSMQAAALFWPKLGLTLEEIMELNDKLLEGESSFEIGNYTAYFLLFPTITFALYA